MNTPWLIAIDGSVPSLKAVDHAIRELANCVSKPQIFLLNVQAPLSSDITRFVDGKVVEAFHKEAGDTALVGAKQRLTDAGIPYSAHVLLGEAAPTIVAFASDKGCRQIIMGARGFGSVVGLFMGSVSTKVLHLSTVPVLLIK